METQTFECKFKRAFEKDNGGVTLYITKDDGTDMTVYGEALGTSRWQQGARLKIAAQPVRTSKNGKQYQTATSIENLDGEVAVPENNMVSPQGVKTVKDLSAQWKEKYRLTMSNLLAASLQSGKDVNFEQIDGYVRKILQAKMDSVEDLPEDAPW
tara:strand:+ start:236 stop:700 length:465 start_codon:yes stop_codon:yes gene_type:complete